MQTETNDSHVWGGSNRSRGRVRSRAAIAMTKNEQIPSVNQTFIDLLAANASSPAQHRLFQVFSLSNITPATLFWTNLGRMRVNHGGRDIRTDESKRFWKICWNLLMFDLVWKFLHFLCKMQRKTTINQRSNSNTIKCKLINTDKSIDQLQIKSISLAANVNTM